MSAEPLNIARFDSRRDDLRAALGVIRERLSPRGDIVSPRGRQLTREVFGREMPPAEVAETICRDIQTRGLEAVLDYSRRLDGAELTAGTLRVPGEEFCKAHERADDAFLATVRRIRASIHEFQSAVLPRDARVQRVEGVSLEQRYLPLRRVGICVPGGAAAYPSTVLMTAVPAQVAGVEQLAVVAPPTQFGAYNDDLLATCHELGIREVYRVGGAQAVAMLAYGIEGVGQVDKIVGPGNLFVALAKKYVFGEVDIDSIAGPSEVVVLADDQTPPSYLAADLIAQAEHAPGASMLVTWSERVLEETATELERQLESLSRGDLARESLEEFGALVLVRNSDEAAELADWIAPEHLHIATEDAAPLAAKIRNAGAIFLGSHTPVALGDYVAGPSHVLPTGGTARFASALCAADFLRSTSMISYCREALAQAAGDVRMMADREALTAHRASVEIRLRDEAL